ncbi:mitochondrial carrier [Dacryopinax primogenitus]|uniref:Mitochondrial carrier n=1 Tax=Dacryopinax primogenitus (strain DJM 731) TaxID=1858805 RepID=M5G8L5_DACPD|nr:mitochondrial carrier [Dacryopinax primogenitus]EJU05089.1 mitochondrial carrier [Dacryopinax primogenitus]
MSEQLTPFGHALAGALGAVFSNTIVYPLDTIKTRIQAGENKVVQNGKEKHLGAWDLMSKIIREEGVVGYYAGYAATMLSTFSQSYAYFLAYTIVRTSYLRRLAARTKSTSTQISIGMELLLGAVAGALAQIFTIPVSVIATRQQIGNAHLHSTHARKEERDNSFFAVARDIIREDGITGLWAGLKPGLVLTVNPAITYGVFERMKGIVLARRRETKLKPWTAFLVGAMSKTLATVVTYPYIMAKIRLQAKWHGEEDIVPAVDDAPSFAEVAAADPEQEVREKAKQVNGTVKPGKVHTTHHEKYRGAVDLLADVLRQDGFKGWYEGMETQITKAVICQAMLFMMKDQFEHVALLLTRHGRRVVAGAAGKV